MKVEKFTKEILELQRRIEKSLPGYRRARLEGRLERLKAAERAEQEARQAAGEKAEEAVVAFLEAASALLWCASSVSEADAADVAEMLDILGSWWEPRSREDEADETPGVLEFPAPDM